LEQEAMQRRALRRNRTVATGLLLTMAAVFVATATVRDAGFWTALLHAVAEAGVVGGLADWFAVTAVFRHPLGLPIPHTAIIPRSKIRIGEGLGAFLERHFLTEELILSKLRALDVASRIGVWLAAPGRAETLATRAVGLAPSLIRAVDDAEIRAFTARALGRQLREIDVAPLLETAVTLMTAGGYHTAVLDRGVDFAIDYLDRNAERLELAAGERERERRRWWIPRAVDRQIARALLRGLKELLHDLQQPDSKARRRLLGAIDELARDLATSPERRAKVEAAKLRLLGQPEVQQWLGSIWDQARDLVLADLASPESKTREGLATALASAGRTLLADASIRERVNGAAEAAVLRLLPWRRELAQFIAEVVRRWDERILVERMELAVGADLQYVRITGTLVGGSIGCVLFLLSSVLR
jgi:uncharacterized membrane-anchored protein YjiN (DUF445 family)